MTEKINKTCVDKGKALTKCVDQKIKASDKRQESTDKENYLPYIYRVLKQVHPDSSISSKSMLILNCLVNDLFERIAKEASKIATYKKRSTISLSEVQIATHLVLSGELERYAHAEAMKAMTNCYGSINAQNNGNALDSQWMAYLP